MTKISTGSSALTACAPTKSPYKLDYAFPVNIDLRVERYRLDNGLEVTALHNHFFWEEPRIFEEIRRLGAVEEDEMDRVFNRGIGMALVVSPVGAVDVLSALATAGLGAAVIGEVAAGSGVQFA